MYPLSCEVCRGSGHTCSGKTKTCEAGKDACVVLVSESSTRSSLRTHRRRVHPTHRAVLSLRVTGRVWDLTTVSQREASSLDFIGSDNGGGEAHCHEEGRKSVNTFKACMKFKDCYSGFVSTTMSPNDYMVSNAHCCQSDGCNSGSVLRSPEQSDRERPDVSLLIAPFQETCPGTQAARCVGRETHCIYFAGNVQAGIINTKFATRGCATESACHTKEGAEVPSAYYLYFLRRADCLPAPYPPGRGE
ncbi:phospholipase A2 inhibitor and Ly6/PLAUR domain-containing protein [Apodemus speciosus]|uniref:Phospholipase A2 inhibitor and Ly6/PLAUR domain-containing protein n=1 Tax=Apodemus speciosus TaxID=105296 RepID=A0ABQ0EXD0_APOSI